MKRSRQNVFDVSIYNSPSDIIRFHSLIHDLRKLAIKAEPSIFHNYLNRLAEEGRLLRHYTQNIDCIEQTLCNLSERTVHLHGRIDQVTCQYCNWSGSLLPDQFCGPDTPSCDHCRGASIQRQRIGKRALSIGSLRPGIVLYGEENPNGTVIGKIAEEDVRTGPDVVYVVGTSLKVPGAKRLVRELCRATEAQGGSSVWINRTPPPYGFKFDFMFLGDCDIIASRLIASM